MIMMYENGRENVEEIIYRLEHDRKIIARREKEKATKPQCPVEDIDCPYFGMFTRCCLLEKPTDCDDFLIWMDD